MIDNNEKELEVFFNKIYNLSAEGITDILINEVKGIAFRKNGEITNIVVKKNYSSQIFNNFFNTLNDIEKENYRQNKSVVKSLTINQKRYRLTFYNEYYGNAITVRILKNKPISLENLGIDFDVIEKIVSNNFGLVLISGPTSSGKSTTLSSIIDYISKKYSYHILTIEDPVEYIYEGKNSFVSQREIGSEVDNYKQAIKDSLRSNPNVILVGEIRDKDTAEEVMRARQTGHLVFSTIHADCVINTIERFVSLFPERERHTRKIALSNTLKGIVNQRLLKTNQNKMELVYEHIYGTIPVLSKIREDNAKLIQLRNIMEQEQIQTLDTKLKRLYRIGSITYEQMLENSTSYLKSELDNENKGF